MNDLSGENTYVPDAETGVRSTGAIEKPNPTDHGQQTSGGETQENVNETPRTTGFLPSLGWLGLVLLVVGLIAIGMAVGNNQNNRVDDEPAVSGNLGPVAGLAANDVIGPNAVIGEVVLPATVAAFADPNGESIARVDAGTYGVLDSEPGWARVVLLGPNPDGFYITGWIQINEETTLTLD